MEPGLSVSHAFQEVCRLQFVASGKKCAPDGYRIDVDGSLVVDTAADMFEEVPASTAEVEPSGRGKRRPLQTNNMMHSSSISMYFRIEYVELS